MTPLEVTALVPGPLVLPGTPVSLDGLLAAVIMAGEQAPPASIEERPLPELPLARHPRGFWHASRAHLVVADWQLRHWTRRLPHLGLLTLLSHARRLPTAGRYKAFHVPLRAALPQGARLTWWAVGDAREVAGLLAHVHGLGGKRAHGYGWVARWEVREVDHDWSLLGPDGPTRPLPPDMAPEGWPYLDTTRLAPPYWRRDGMELLAVPPPPEEAWR